MKLEPRRSPLFILQAIKAGDKAGDEATVQLYSCNIDGPSDRKRELATWHALHQGKAKETILERREYGTMRCMVCC